MKLLLMNSLFYTAGKVCSRSARDAQCQIKLSENNHEVVLDKQCS